MFTYPTVSVLTVDSGDSLSASNSVGGSPNIHLRFTRKSSLVNGSQLWTMQYRPFSAFQVSIENGADPSLKADKRLSLLHCAVQGGNLSIINKLSSLGLDIDSRNGRFNRTPLMCAAADGKQSAFEMLIQNGADPSLKDVFHQNLLHFASQGGDMTIINKLLCLRLDIDSRSSPDDMR